MVANAVEKNVVALFVAGPTFGEILFSVINDMIRADGPYHVQIPGAANAGHLRAEGLGDLHSEGTDATGGSVNPNLQPRLDALVFSQTSLAETLPIGE